MKDIAKARRELDIFNKLLDDVWDEEMTDRDEMIYLSFFKAGIKTAEIECSYGEEE